MSTKEELTFEQWTKCFWEYVKGLPISVEVKLGKKTLRKLYNRHHSYSSAVGRLFFGNS